MQTSNHAVAGVVVELAILPLRDNKGEGAVDMGRQGCCYGMVVMAQYNSKWKQGLKL